MTRALSPGESREVEMKPRRIQLSRRKGFRLQEASLALNGLPAVKVDRSTKFGNPFIVSEKVPPGREFKGVAYGLIVVPSAEDAVECFREFMETEGPRADAFRASLPELRGRNLACWCSLAPGTHCHADVLLELALANVDSLPKKEVGEWLKD